MRTGRIILFAGLSLLTVGILLIGYSFFIKHDPINAKATELAKKLYTAEPQFEIGYAQMTLDFYQKNRALYEAGDSSLLTFPIYQNEIATRIASNSPPVVPTYSAAFLAQGSPEGFGQLYKKKQLEHTGTGIICLIVKQVGLGNAQATTLQAMKVTIKGAYELYEASELDGNNHSINSGQNKSEKQVFSLGTMKTGRALIIPLCITNQYWKINSESDPSHWQVTNHIAYIPLSISFSTSQGKKVALPIHDTLLNPIYMD